MANLSGYILTDAGKHLLTAANAGSCTLQMTKVKLSADAIDSVNDLVDKTDLIGTNLKLLKISGTKATQNTCTIYAVVTNAGQDTNFTVRQDGVFAKGIAVENPPDGVTPEDISETLFAVAYDPLPDIIPAQNGAVNITKQFNINLLIENASSIKVTVDPTGILTSEVLEDHNQSDTAHENKFKQYLKEDGDTATDLLQLAPDIITNLQTKISFTDKSGILAPTAWVQGFVEQLIGDKLDNDKTIWDGNNWSYPPLDAHGLMAQNGYVVVGKLGGLCLQWGLLSISNVNGQVVSLPISYEKTHLATVCIDGGIGCFSWGVETPILHDRLSDFTVYACTSAGQLTTAYGCFISVGQ